MTVSGDWTPLEWAKSDNYYAATTANVFHSRRAYLRAPANATDAGGAAAAAMAIPQADSYHVLIRYEAAYRFETPFEVTIEQQGKQLFRKVYGRRTNKKLWPFGGNRMGPAPGS